MPLKQKTDEELMMLYQNGSEDAFRILYARHSSKIFGFIKSRIHTSERCHDVFQEVFMKIHKSKHLYNKSHPVLPWLFTITKNAIVDDARKAKKILSQIQIDDLELAAPPIETGLAVPFFENGTKVADLVRQNQKEKTNERAKESDQDLLT